MGTGFRGMAVWAVWTASGVALAAPDVPERFPPGPWLTDVRVLGPDAQWSGVFPIDPDLPALTVKPGSDGRRADARKTAFAARGALTHPLPEWWQSVPGVRPFLPVPSADRALLVADAERLERWFADHGWLDCTVTVELAVDPTAWGRWLNRRRADSALQATYVVDTGERWTVRDVQLEGTAELPRPLRRALRGAVSVEPGAYDGAARSRTEEALRRVLSERGFSHPHVSTLLVPTDTEQSVTLLIDVDAGLRAQFGPVEIEGLPPVTTERLALRLAPIVPEGERWDAARIDGIEAALGSIPALARVAVSPGTPDAQQRVPVQVAVTTADVDGFFPIVSVASDPTFYAFEVGAGYRSHAVGRQLSSFEARGSAGYRSFPVISGPDTFWGNHGPSGRVSVANEVYLQPLRGLSLLTETEGSLDALWANNMVTGAFRAGLRLRPLPGLELSATPELALWQSFAWPAQQSLWEPWFAIGDRTEQTDMMGRDRPTFRPSALGALARLRMRWIRVDQPLLPSRGGELWVDAIPWGTAGTDPFWRVHLDMRRFLRLGSPRWVLVPRTELGMLRFQDPEADAVPQLRFPLGGGTSLRGWSSGLANPPGWDGGPSDFRIGGNVVALGSLELQYAVWSRLHVFGFTDVGRTWEHLLDHADSRTGTTSPGVRAATLLPAAGVGLALPTPVGRAALSTAVRLRTETELQNPPPMATIHFVLVQRY